MSARIVIGAGPAGLAAAYGRPGTIVLEAGDTIGGLCRSIEIGGAVFDLGGHSFHTPHGRVGSFVDRLMNGDWHCQTRDARVAYGGTLIAYPFQDHFSQLADRNVVAECEAGLAARTEREPANFEDWIDARFGDGIARHFMLPYNRKLWARDLRTMSCEWVGARIAGAGQAGDDVRQPLATDSEVGYPAAGGFDRICRAMAAQCDVRLASRVVAIDASARIVQTADGAVFEWKRLVSTIPLPALLRITRSCPAELRTAAESLQAVSLKILCLVVAGPVTDEPQRIYIADPAVPAHKIAFNHTSSPALRARPVQAVSCEIAYSPDKPLEDGAILTRTMIDWLASMRLVHADDVIETRMIDVPLAYPVYMPERPAIRAQALAWLSARGIDSIGRFGRWDYVNSDACILQGLEAE